jgi:hypothetical protein
MDYSLHISKDNFYKRPMVTTNYTKPLFGVRAILRSDNHDYQKSKTCFPYITMIFIFFKSQNVIYLL